MPALIPIDELTTQTGFRSMYMFSEEMKNHIEAIGNMSNLQHWSVTSDTLFVDFDDNQEAADKMIADMAPYDFTAWHSGGRSIHLHIPIKEMSGRAVPNLQKQWMKENYPLADLSIYKTVGIYRLPGTYHVKYPGNQKELIQENITGKNLEIDVKIKPPISLPGYVFEEDKDYNEWLDSLLFFYTKSGGRNNQASLITYVSKKAGKTKEQARELLNLWNNAYCRPPLDNSELGNILERKWR